MHHRAENSALLDQDFSASIPTYVVVGVATSDAKKLGKDQRREEQNT
jgi:hypothetical protein